MSNTSFEPLISTNSIWVGDDDSVCLTDTLEDLETDLAGKASTDHTHTGYATADHTHSGYASSTHTHSQSDVSGLETALAGKASTDHTHTGYAAVDHTHSGYAAAGHTHSEYAQANHTHSGYAASSHGHAQSEITGLADALSGKAAADHTHSGYALTDHTHSGYASADHTHSGYAAADHTHTGYAASEHSHDQDDISGLADALSQAGIPIVTASSTDGVNYTATVPGMTSLVIGKPFIIVPNKASTSISVKLNVNDLGQKNLRQSLSSVTSATVPGSTDNWLALNKPVMVMWDGLFFRTWISRPSANDLYGTVPVESGGTGATTAEAALTALGAASASALAALEERVSALENQ